jgi:hypothetical protein
MEQLGESTVCARLDTKSATTPQAEQIHKKGALTENRFAKMQNNVVDDREALKTGLKITTNNASSFLEYHKAYRVLICIVYSYVIRNLADHLSRNHVGSKRERGEVVRQYRSLLLHDAKHVPLPPPLEQPFLTLGKLQRAFICKEAEYQYLSANCDRIRIHCNKQHNWKSSTEKREN